MLTASTAVKDTIKQALAVMASPRVVVEWNHNRYSTVSEVDNWGSSTEDQNAYDPEVFPISEIVKPLRPTAGILLGKTGEGIVTSTYSDAPEAYRTYTSSPDSKYKYWTSQVRSGTGANGGGGYTIDSTKASPYVVYSASVWTNKIYLCFESSWAKPVVYNIDTTTDGTNWTTVATNVVPASDGSVTLYRQSGGSWTSTVAYGNPTQLRGIRVVCSSVSKQNAFLNVIEMGLRLEDDLTSYLISYETEMSMAEADFVAPIGQISSNTGSVILSNLDGRFNTVAPSGVDPTPLYRGLIDANAKVTIDLGIDSSAYGGSAYEYLRVATMYTDSWSGDDETSTLEIKDASKFLQELFPVQMLMSDVTAGKAIWRMLDSVGFNNYKYSRAAAENANKIPFFWTDSAKTVWEQIQDVCQVTQAAAYFDAYGVFQIKTQQAAFDFTQIGSPVWTFDYALNGSKQPDIITLTPGSQYEANKVTVHYKPTALATDSRGKPSQEQVWAPDGDVVLRSSALKADMTSTQLFFNIDTKDASYWPYSGMVNIRGELIKYDGKTYRYVDKTSTWQTKVIHSNDEKLHVDKDLSSATLGYQNYFTGRMTVTERGYDWTTKAAHDTTIAAWKTAGPAFGAVGGAQTTWTGGLDHMPADSIMRMTGRSTWTDNTFYCAPHNQQWATTPSNIGMRFRFPKNTGSSHHGGIFVHSNSGLNSMYIIDIMSTTYCDSTDSRTSRDEIRILKRDSGTLTPLNGRGVEHSIFNGIWYDIDLLVSGDTISVFVNGHLATTATDAALTKTAKLGPYVRGYTVMDLEYFYYAAQGGWPDPDTDNSSYLDLIEGGYYSDQHYRDGFYRTRTARRKHGKRSITYKQQYAQRFFDEFGILVHEVRPYKVTFEKGPATYSDLYFSNQSQVVALEYSGTPFGASFILANASRVNAVVQGDDEITFGSGNTVNQILRIFGRTVQQQDEKTIEVKSEAAIRARGEVSLDISSDWIQTEDHATDLANWISAHWSTPADEIDIEIFGNPLLEITDVVGVNYPLLNMDSTTHQFFVTKISQNYDDGGLSTTVSLRRARNAIY